MARFDGEKRKSALDKRAASSKTAIAPLAGGADLPTTVTKVNALIAQLKAAGIIG